MDLNLSNRFKKLANDNPQLVLDELSELINRLENKTKMKHFSEWEMVENNIPENMPQQPNIKTPKTITTVILRRSTRVRRPPNRLGFESETISTHQTKSHTNTKSTRPWLCRINKKRLQRDFADQIPDDCIDPQRDWTQMHQLTASLKLNKSK